MSKRTQSGVISGHLSVSAVLRMPAYRLFLLIQFMNATIVWILVTSVQWLFVADGQSGFIIASVPALLAFSFIVLALPVGVVVVRWKRPKVIAVGMFMVALASAGAAIWVLVDANNIFPAIVSVMLAGIGLVVSNLSWQSLYPLLTGRSGIVPAAVLDGAAFNGARAIGPLLAGVLLAVVLPNTLLWANAVLALAATVLAFCLSHTDTADPIESVKVRAELVSALRFSRYSRWTQSLIVRMVGFVVPASGLWALLPIYSRDILGVNSTQFGYLFAATGAGAVLGTLIVGPMRTLLTERAFAGIGAGIFGLALVMLPWTTTPWLVVVLLLFSGVCWVTVQTLWLSLAQRALPDWVRAGIIGLLFTCFQAAQMVGSFVWGALADWVGVTSSLVATGGLMLVVAMDILLRGVPPTDGIAPEPAYARTPSPPPDLNPAQPVTIEVVHYGLQLNNPKVSSVLDAVRLSRLRYGAQSWSLVADQNGGLHREVMRFSSWEAFEVFEGQRLTRPELEVRRRLEKFVTKQSEIRISNFSDR
jgi:hypothetical protein